MYWGVISWSRSLSVRVSDDCQSGGETIVGFDGMSDIWVSGLIIVGGTMVGIDGAAIGWVSIVGSINGTITGAGCWVIIVSSVFLIAESIFDMAIVSAAFMAAFLTSSKDILTSILPLDESIISCGTRRSCSISTVSPGAIMIGSVCSPMRVVLFVSVDALIIPSWIGGESFKRI